MFRERRSLDENLDCSGERCLSIVNCIGVVEGIYCRDQNKERGMLGCMIEKRESTRAPDQILVVYGGLFVCEARHYFATNAKSSMHISLQ